MTSRNRFRSCNTVPNNPRQQQWPKYGTLLFRNTSVQSLLHTLHQII